MGFNTLRRALLERADRKPDGLGKLIEEVNKFQKDKRRAKKKAPKTKKDIEEAFRRRQKRVVNPNTVYDCKVRATKLAGLGSLLPCSFLSAKPGAPVKAGGNRAVIRWGLSDGETDVVVVTLEKPLKMARSDANTTWGFFPLGDITPCDCGGHKHERCA